MSSIIRRRNGVIVISLRSKIGRGPPTQPREEILSTVQISDAALTLGEAVSPIQGISFDPGLGGASKGSKKRGKISVLQANSLRIRTGNFLPPNRELNRAIREIPALIRESRSRRPFRHFP
jgi:hypothetical protein